MKKKVFFSMILVCILSLNYTNAQVDSKDWPRATVDYFQQPRVLIGAHITPVLGLPYTGIFYGVDANVKVAKILYVNAGFLAPLLDMSFIDGSEHNYAFYGGGELVLRNKKTSDQFDLTISQSRSGDVVTTKYRDYYVKVYEPSVFRFGGEYYMNAQYSPNFLNTKRKFEIDGEYGLQMPNGQIISHSSTLNCFYFYLGIGKKSLNYFKIKMPDYQESDKFTSTLTGYFDLFYAPFIKLTPFMYAGQSYDPADFYRVMPFGGRFGFEYYKTSGKYLGFYTRMEIGMMPGIGFPVYGKIGIGISSIFTKLKSIGNELQ
jgi:hypothetical protein